MMTATSRLLEAVVTRMGRWAAWLMLALMATILFDVVTRRFLVLGSTRLQELEWHLHGVLFLLSLGFAYVRNAHVRIELIRTRLRPRIRIWIELLGNLFFLIPYCAVLIYFDYEFARRAFVSGEISASMTGLGARWVIKGMVGVGFVLLAMAGLAVTLRCLRLLRAHRPDDHALFPQARPETSHLAEDGGGRDQ